MFPTLLKYISQLCYIAPPPAIDLASSPHGVLPKEIRDLQSASTELKTISNNLDQSISRLNAEFDALKSRMITMDSKGTQYINEKVKAEMAIIDIERRTLQDKKTENFQKSMTLERFLQTYLSTSDAIAQQKLLTDATKALNDLMNKSGGIAVMKDTMENASSSLQKAEVMSSMSNVIIATPTTSSSIVENMKVVNDSQYNDDMFAEAMRESDMRTKQQNSFISFPSVPKEEPSVVVQPTPTKLKRKKKMVS